VDALMFFGRNGMVNRSANFEILSLKYKFSKRLKKHSNFHRLNRLEIFFMIFWQKILSCGVVIY